VRPEGKRDDLKTAYAEVEPDVYDTIKAGARAARITFAAALETIVRSAPKGEDGVPLCLQQRAVGEQLQLSA